MKWKKAEDSLKTLKCWLQNISILKSRHSVHQKKKKPPQRKLKELATKLEKTSGKHTSNRSIKNIERWLKIQKKSTDNTEERGEKSHNLFTRWGNHKTNKNENHFISTKAVKIQSGNIKCWKGNISIKSFIDRWEKMFGIISTNQIIPIPYSEIWLLGEHKEKLTHIQTQDMHINMFIAKLCKKAKSWKTCKMPIHRRINEYTMVYSCIGLLFSNVKEL